MKQPTWERIATHVILIIACSIALFPVLWIVSTSFKNQFDVLSTEIELIPESRRSRTTRTCSTRRRRPADFSGTGSGTRS